jgi:hypothetical protein
MERTWTYDQGHPKAKNEGRAFLIPVGREDGG